MTEKKQKNRPQDLRAAIIKTALHLFTANGYFNTSVHDIRREAGISIGAIYHHFDSKEEIAKAIYNDLLEQETEAIDQLTLENQTAHDSCRAIMSHLFVMTEENPEAMEFMLYSKHREFMPSALPVCSSKPLSMMRKAVQLGIDNGEILPMEITLATTCLFGSMFRMIHLRLDGVVTEPLPTFLDTMFDCAWRGVAR